MSGATEVLGVLQEILDLLTDPTSGCAVSPAPCRVLLSPGSSVAWDSCGEGDCTGKDGQLWANINSLTVVVDQPPCQRVTWSATIGIVRCAHDIKEDGTFPTPGEIEADAVQQGLDADAIWDALTCCEARSDSLHEVRMVSWIALGPNGGCVGGQWTIKGVLDVCC